MSDLPAQPPQAPQAEAPAGSTAVLMVPSQSHSPASQMQQQSDPSHLPADNLPARSFPSDSPSNYAAASSGTGQYRQEFSDMESRQDVEADVQPSQQPTGSAASRLQVRDVQSSSQQPQQNRDRLAHVQLPPPVNQPELELFRGGVPSQAGGLQSAAASSAGVSDDRHQHSLASYSSNGNMPESGAQASGNLQGAVSGMGVSPEGAQGRAVQSSDSA